mgnify:CR=1 FL=1
MLSKKNRYAFHALLDLAEHQNEGPRLISEIADAKQIPKKFLETILLELKKAGFLGSKMGKGGGYYLLKKPNEIHFADVIRLVDGPIALLPCVSLNYYEKCDECISPEEVCGLKRVMTKVRDESLKVLENRTIEDML